MSSLSTPKKLGDTTHGAPSTSKSRGETCPPVHPQIYAQDAVCESLTDSELERRHKIGNEMRNHEPTNQQTFLLLLQ